MDDGREFKPSGGGIVHRYASRCVTCRAFWMSFADELCACGGHLERYDITAEIAKLPYKPFEPPK